MQLSPKEFLNSTCESAEEVGRSFTEPDDDWIPVLQTVSSDGQMFVFGFEGGLLVNDASKDLLAHGIMCPVITGTGAKLVSTVFSAWMLKLEADEEMKRTGEYTGPRPSESPNRIEVVMITVITPTEVIWASAEIFRDDINPPTLGEWEQVTSGDSLFFSGRFMEPLQAALRDSSGQANPEFLSKL